MRKYLLFFLFLAIFLISGCAKRTKYIPSVIDQIIDIDLVAMNAGQIKTQNENIDYLLFCTSDADVTEILSRLKLNSLSRMKLIENLREDGTSQLYYIKGNNVLRYYKIKRPLKMQDGFLIVDAKKESISYRIGQKGEIYLFEKK